MPAGTDATCWLTRASTDECLHNFNICMCGLQTCCMIADMFCVIKCHVIADVFFQWRQVLPDCRNVLYGC